MQNPASANTARRLLAASLLSVFATLGAHAAVLTWDASGVNATTPVGGAGVWSTANANWSNGTADVAWNNSNGDSANINTSPTGTVTLGGNITVANLALSGSGYVIAKDTADAFALTINGTISGGGTITARLNGTFTKTGGSNLTLQPTSANAYSGDTLVQGGSLIARSAGALPAATRVILGNNATSATFSIRTATVTVAGIGTSGTGTTNKIQTDTNQAAGTLVVNPDNAGAGAVDSTFGGAIQNGDATHVLSLTKAGGRTLTLTGTNSYTGATLISGGTLKLGSSLTASSGVTVNGGTLAGNDSPAIIALGAGPVSMSGATSAITPGGAGFAGAFSLAPGQNLTVSGGALNFDLGDASSDQISGSGGGLFSISGTTLLNLNLVSGFSYNNSYDLLHGFGGGSTISGLTITGYDTTNWAAALGTDGVLSFAPTSVPEPSSFAALAGALALSAGALRRRRRA